MALVTVNDDLRRAREFEAQLKACKCADDVHAVLNSEACWRCIEGVAATMAKLFAVSGSVEFEGVVADVARMVMGTGMRLVGEGVEDELQDHFLKTAAQFVYQSIRYIATLGFVPVIWFMDPVTTLPTFRVADWQTSRFDIFHNHVTKAQIILRWDLERHLYDPATEFYIVRMPSPTGAVDTIAAKLLPRFEVLVARRDLMLAEIRRPARLVLQKRPRPEGDTHADALEEALLEMTAEVCNQPKRKRTNPDDVVEMIKVGCKGDETEFMLVKDEYQVVSSIANGNLAHPAPSRTALEVYNAESQRFRALVYRLFGLPADAAEERRREYGNAREASNHDTNRASHTWAGWVHGALTVAVELAYPVLYVDKEEGRMEIEREKELAKAVATVAYLEELERTGKPMPPNIEAVVRPPSPTLDECCKMLRKKVPRVELFPHREFTTGELTLIRESNALDDEKTLRVHAQALNLPEMIPDAPAPKRARAD